MKKITKYLLENKILIIVLLIIALGLPSAIFKKAQGEITTIVVAVGIDKENDEYKVSIQSANSLFKESKTSSVSSQSQSEPKLEVVDAQGKSIADAINKLEIKTGRTLGFEHCHLIVLADSVASENCKNILDFFYRKANITLGAYLISTDKGAKTLLEKTCDSGNTSTSNLQKNLGFNKNNFSSSNLTTIGDFFNDFYSKSKTSTMMFLKSETAAETDGDAVNNEGQCAVFYNGKKFDVLDGSLTKGLNFVNLDKLTGKMVIDNVNDNIIYKNATVTINIDEGKIKKSISVKNDFVIMNLEIDLKIEVLEINSQQSEFDINNGTENFLNDVLKEKIKETIKNELNVILTYCKENEIDLCNFLNYLYAFKNSDYKKVSSSFSIKEILEKSAIDAKINIYSFR